MGVNEIYLIEMLWIDLLENDFSDAYGYKTIGFVLTENDAKKFCSKGKTYFEKDYLWPLRGLGDMPQYKYKKIIQISGGE